MDILSFKPGHDGHIALLSDGNLKFSIEEEKDSGPRYGEISQKLYLKALQHLEKAPDVIAANGWFTDAFSSGYFGESEEKTITEKIHLAGREFEFFSSTHERSHILCSYGLSPFPQGQACYALVWEGLLGAFYKIDEKLRITKLGVPLEKPGLKYQLLYAIADKSLPHGAQMRMEDAGKLMALVSYGKSGPPNQSEADLINHIFAKQDFAYTANKAEFSQNPFCNVGIESPIFKQVARKFSDALFERFLHFAQENLNENLPLLISGGCGLNCDWNSNWKKSGLFSDVFVPPCTNDSGAAIGTAIDAQRHYTGSAKVEWNAYAGEPFVEDNADMSGIIITDLDLRELARFLQQGNVIAWVQGRYEIGPRALGNRSIIAMPFSSDIHQRLNAIKEREGFRPIAPICIEEDIDKYFENHGPSPHMLYFQRVLTPNLPAITHVDGSARLQSVNAQQNPEAYALLRAFKELTGYGVLCNTSLNFKGRGFINRMSDLVAYCKNRDLDGFVVGKKFYRIERKIG